MTQNSTNSSEIHFQNTSGTLEVADRLRYAKPGTFHNLAFTYSSPTFTVHGADGTALSATNPGYVVINSNSSPGLLKIIEVTANQTFTDDNGTSTIIGNLFGLTTSIATNQDIPFFVYAVIDSTETAALFTISRATNKLTAPAAGTFAKTGSAVATTQGSMFALGDPTIANYASRPCVLLGQFRMRMSASDDWTVQTFATNEGIGRLETKYFNFPTGQFGSATGKVFKDNGGTAPSWTSQAYIYGIDAYTGMVHLNFAGSTISVSGAGAVQALIALPYTNDFGGLIGQFVDGSVLGTLGYTGAMTKTNASTFGQYQNADITGNLNLGGNYRASSN